MNTKLKWLAAVTVVAAGGFYAYNLRATSGHVPADLRDAVADSSALGQLGLDRSVDVPAPGLEAVNKGYVAGGDSLAGAPVKPVEFISIPGGKFTMGTDSDEKGFEDAKPIHEVAIKTFDISKTAVTVEQYAECVIKGGCTEPATRDYCNWGVAGRQFHPINCVSWDQAVSYTHLTLPTNREV